MRQIALDTETTGLSPTRGHRITEIGLVEILDRKLTGRKFRTYINPEREVDKEAEKITGLNLKFLSNYPTFSEAVSGFLDFILEKTPVQEGGFAEHTPTGFIIHNAPFDLGFLNHELKLLKHELCPLEHYFGVCDTLKMARHMKILNPGQKNSLDTLCEHYGIDNKHREKHGALLDAELLADVYLAMTEKPEFVAMIEGSILNGFLC